MPVALGGTGLVVAQEDPADGERQPSEVSRA